MEDESEKRYLPKLVPTGELANPWLFDASCHVLFAPHHDSAQNACISISFALCGPALGPVAAGVRRTHPLYLPRARHMRRRASPRLAWLCLHMPSLSGLSSHRPSTHWYWRQGQTCKSEPGRHPAGEQCITLRQTPQHEK